MRIWGCLSYAVLVRKTHERATYQEDCFLELGVEGGRKGEVPDAAAQKAVTLGPIAATGLH